MLPSLPFDLVTLGALDAPRRNVSSGIFRTVDLLRGKFVKVLEVASRSTASDWAPTSCGRLKEKKVSIHHVRVSFVVSPPLQHDVVSPLTKETNTRIHLHLHVTRLFLYEMFSVSTFVIDFELKVLYCIV